MTKATKEEAVCLDLQMQSDVREAVVAGNGYGGWSSQPRESSHPEQAKAEWETTGVFKVSAPTFIALLRPTRPHLLDIPQQHHSWGPSGEIHEI